MTLLRARDNLCSPVDVDDGKVEPCVEGIERGKTRAQHEFLIPEVLARIERPVRDADHRDGVGEPAEQRVQIRLWSWHLSSPDSR